MWHRCVLRPEPNFFPVVIFEVEPPVKQPRDKFEITNSTLMLADAFVSFEHNHMKPANGSVCIFSAFSCEPASSLGSPLSFKEGEGVRVKWCLQHVLIFVTVPTPTPSLKKRKKNNQGRIYSCSPFVFVSGHVEIVLLYLFPFFLFSCPVGSAPVCFWPFPCLALRLPLCTCFVF